MEIRVFTLVVSLSIYLLFLLIAQKLKWSKYRTIVINVILGVIIIPLISSEVTGYKLNITIQGLERKIVSQEFILSDISSKIVTALNDECLKDLEERKRIISQLHDKDFQIEKQDYDNIIDSIFDEVKQLQNKRDQLSTEQKKLSDESLIYFEFLTKYVLDKFDNIVEQLNGRKEVLDIERTEIPKGFFYADDGQTIINRKVQLKKSKEIKFKITNRKVEDGKLVFLPAIDIVANNQSPRISISGPPIEELEIGPKSGGISQQSEKLLKIKYSLGEDPLMSESFRNSIDQKISEFIKILYF